MEFRSIRRAAPKTFWVGVAFLGLVLLYAVWMHSRIPESVNHIFLVLLAVVGVHLLDRVLLLKEAEEFAARLKAEAAEELRERLDESADRTEAAFLRKLNFLKAARESAIERIYVSRAEARSDILKAIEEAREKAWILAVSLDQTVRFDDIHAALAKSRCPDVNQRILLLNGLRSPALFRAFLEEPPRHIRRILEHDRTAEPSSRDPYFDTRVYDCFARALRVIARFPDLTEKVRFYSHAPSCWLVIADGVAFFEPYTFGRVGSDDPVAHPPKRPTRAPLFAFADSTRSEAYQILYRHFDRLWRTSDTDAFHARVTLEEDRQVLRRMFETRSRWLHEVYGALYGGGADGTSLPLDRRRHPRKLCAPQLGPHILTVHWQEDGRDAQLHAEVRESSLSGLSLLVRGEQSSLPTVGTEVSLSCEQECEDTIVERMTNYFTSRDLIVARDVHMQSEGTEEVGILALKVLDLPSSDAGGEDDPLASGGRPV
ncbi:MAG: hypothetical protein GF330_12680 [Candidatus Eisenbacteria bacterium]|nr:hypothetical protein [Candidatus Eisenbacteria bacterium]